jgi:MFS family permease
MNCFELFLIVVVQAFCLASMSEYCGYVLTFNLLPLINAEIGKSSSQHNHGQHSSANQLLGPDPNIVWVATGYTLAIGVSCLVWGRLSDIFGRRWFFIGGNALALIGSILGSTAPNVTALIFCQVMVGLAFPAQLSFSVALAELIPNSLRGYMNGLLFFVAMPFSTFGPVIARLLQENTAQGWRWAYYINVILVGLTMILSLVCYHPPDFSRLHTKVTKTQVFKNMDYGGIVLFAAGVALTLTGLNWGGQQYAWVSGQTLGALIGGLVSMVLFIFWGELH